MQPSLKTVYETVLYINLTKMKATYHWRKIKNDLSWEIKMMSCIKVGIATFDLLYKLIIAFNSWYFVSVFSNKDTFIILSLSLQFVSFN